MRKLTVGGGQAALIFIIERSGTGRCTGGVVKAQLEKILVDSWAFARQYDGCNRSNQDTAEFKKGARDIFALIAAQKRGGRKLFVNTVSSPINGLDQIHFIWWGTVKGNFFYPTDHL